MPPWTQSEASGLVFPAPAAKPPEPKPREYLLVCPRCRRPVQIGAEHEAMYRFDCPCGGATVKVGPFGGETEVASITWKRPAPFLGAAPLRDPSPTAA